MKIRLGAFLLPSAGATPAEFERGFAGQQLRAEYNGAGWREQSEVDHGRA